MAGAQTRGSRHARGRADTTAGPTASDLDDQRRQRRERDAPIERAHRAGYTGGDRAEFADNEELAQHYDDGAALKKREDRLAQRDATVGAAGAKAGGVASDGAGIILGLFAYALLVSYLQGGVAGTKAWLSAKFLNRPTGGAAKPRTPITAAKPIAANVTPAHPSGTG